MTPILPALRLPNPGTVEAAWFGTIVIYAFPHQTLLACVRVRKQNFESGGLGPGPVGLMETVEYTEHTILPDFITTISSLA